MKQFLKELSGWFRFRKIPPDALRIVFFHENHQYYSYLEGLVRSLTETHGETVYYITTASDDPILDNPPDGIQSFYFKSLLSIVMGSIQCRIFVMTMTDLNHFYLKRSFHPVHYVYAFHSLVSTHMIYRYGSFDHYDSILCVGPHHNREIRKHEALYDVPEKQLVDAGYYRLEQIYEAFQTTEFADATPGNTVLIAPSWGKRNILESVGEQLVELLIHAGYRVIVRPHPETVKRTPEFIERIQRRFDNHEALTIELSVATNDSLFKADVLISDYSGVSLEYALGTNRPVLFLEVPSKINNDRYKDLEMPVLELETRSQIGMVLSPDDLDNVPATIELLKAERSTYQERISQLRDEYVYHFGRSSEIGAEHIMKLLHRTPGQD